MSNSPPFDVQYGYFERARESIRQSIEQNWHSWTESSKRYMLVTKRYILDNDPEKQTGTATAYVDFHISADSGRGPDAHLEEPVLCAQHHLPALHRRYPRAQGGGPTLHLRMSVIIGCFHDSGPGCCWVEEGNANARAAGRAAYSKGWSRYRAPKTRPFTAVMWRMGWEEAQAENPRARKSHS